MSPRVLHFCKDQIAWECSQLDAAKCYLYGVCVELKEGHLKERPRLKYPIPDQYGRRPTDEDLVHVSDAVHENWKRVGERYSKMRLTKEDKLIASSAIAEMMSSEIRGRYIAGMCGKHLASRFLWRVDPKYENGCFSYPSKRPKLENYCAPSFPWAAVDAPQGIKCDETERRSFNVGRENSRDHQVPKPFGLVEEGSDLELVCVMKTIEIRFREKKKGTTHYDWNLASEGETGRKHDNLYLDSPDGDFEDIRVPHGKLYCVWGENIPLATWFASYWSFCGWKTASAASAALV